ncbi:MAG: hypothetical protein BGO68_01600 [Candidatus Amoebophilus sp. 36-38]|nr:MAG: hypothetical protein BGO68_01600 [Candidatus Amoebophilus sp. 36-38]
MRFIFQVILTSLISYILQQFMPSWIVVFVAAIVALFVQSNPAAAFLGGFAAISLLWMCKATIIDVYTNSILSVKVAAILGMKSSIMLILLTGILGGLLGGLGAASGQHLLRIIKKDRGDFYRK